MAYHESFPVSYLGLTTAEAWELLGAPDSIDAVMDDTQIPVPLCSYDSGLTLYWYKDRVWQFSLKSPWSRSFWGISLGSRPDEIKKILGNPFLESDSLQLYRMPDIGFPVEARFYYSDDATLEEFHFYRSDF